MKIKEILDFNDIIGGIFFHLDNLGVPWQTSATTLNKMYISNSGNKEISPFIDLLIESGDTPRESTFYYHIAENIFAMFNENWKYLYSAIFADYDPIENYNGISEITETETGKKIETRFGMDSGDKGIKTSTETDITISNAVDSKTTSPAKSENRESAFNSSSYVPQTQTIIGDGTNETRTHGSASDNYQKTKGSADSNLTLIQDTHEERKEESFSPDYEHKTVEKKHGNLGVTTSQQMITSEIELRKTSFFELVFRDIDKMIALSIY